MSRSLKIALPVGLALALGVGGAAHMRLANPSNGQQLFWQNEQSVSIVISSGGSADLPDGSDETAIRMAIQSWNDVPGTTLQLVEDRSESSQERTDWESANVHMVLFDEDGDPWLPPGNGIVAITPVWFESSGRIVDADILFNGLEHSFTTSGELGAFDVQDVAAHELGHLWGLDHSGWAGATMYPYVAPSLVLQRSLSWDEVTGVRGVYPSGSLGRITGTVERVSDGSPVARAHVVARTAVGRTTASVLSEDDGDFTLRGLDPGTYTVYATPFEGPVSKLDLGLNADPDDPVETDFETGFYGSTAVITGGAAVALGTLMVDADVALSVGRNTDLYPLRATKGTSSFVLIRGTGLGAGSTLTLSDPDLTPSSISWGSFVSFLVDVPPGEPDGHVDVQVQSGGATALLPAAIEVAPPTPTVSGTVPASGSMAGGVPVTVSGTGFRAGAKVVIGDRIYADGVSSTTVVSDTTIQLTTGATLPGTHDVVVVDPSGLEGRIANHFVTAAFPQVQVVFPAAGATAGGTDVVVSGQDFLPGIIVRLAGVTQPNVVVEGTNTVRFTTAGTGTPGVQMLELENTDGGTVTSSFTYTAGPDPVLTAVTPASGAPAGGNSVILSGASFPTGAEVFFGADPTTGVGGVAATDVVRVDAATLEVVTPAHPKGTVAVLVRDPVTGQAAMLAAGFTFKDSGGGGGCTMVPVGSDVMPPGQALAGSWWAAALLFVLLMQAARARRQAVRPEAIGGHGVPRRDPR